MVTNEETNFITGNIQTKEEKKKTNQNENGWQSVTIGGVTGILMGAGAMYAAEAFAKDAAQEEVTTNREEEPLSHVATNGLKVAEVDQNLSFGEAFEAARNAIGPGGVFHWHGGIYNTYRLDEWNAMSAGERAQFAQQVQPEIRPGEGQARHYHHDVAQNDNKPEEPEKKKHEEDNKPKPDEPIKQDEPEPNKQEEPVKPDKPHEDGEIHFLGFANVQYEGQEYQAGHMTAHLNGEEKHVYYIDVDQAPDNEFDVAVVDANSDGVLTSQESIDIRDRHINVGEFALASAMDEATQDSNQVAMINQNDIANDMPDYVNDANTAI